MFHWRWAVVGVVGFLAGQAWPSQRADPHWITRTGADWGAMSRETKTAYVDGFLAGAAVEAAAAAGGIDSAGLTAALEARRREGRLRFPYGANVYTSRIDDYFWWENHRPQPLWYAFWEVNATLIGPTDAPQR